MIFFSPQATILQGVAPAQWGLIATPQRRGSYIPAGYLWLADNGCFSGAWCEAAWLKWLDANAHHQARCVMATAPDVVGDAVATLDRYRWYVRLLHGRGWRVGLVAQDGLESLRWPLDYDGLFIGGTIAWKLSDAADWCIRKAQKEGKWTHVGRVNGGRRIRHFKLVGVDSVDGTSICYNPPDEFRKLSNALAYQPLFTLDSI